MPRRLIANCFESDECPHRDGSECDVVAVENHEGREARKRMRPTSDEKIPVADLEVRHERRRLQFDANRARERSTRQRVGGGNQRSEADRVTGKRQRLPFEIVIRRQEKVHHQTPSRRAVRRARIDTVSGSTRWVCERDGRGERHTDDQRYTAQRRVHGQLHSVATVGRRSQREGHVLASIDSVLVLFDDEPWIAAKDRNVFVPGLRFPVHQRLDVHRPRLLHAHAAHLLRVRARDGLARPAVRTRQSSGAVIPTRLRLAVHPPAVAVRARARGLCARRGWRSRRRPDDAHVVQRNATGGRPHDRPPVVVRGCRSHRRARWPMGSATGRSSPPSSRACRRPAPSRCPNRCSVRRRPRAPSASWRRGTARWSRRRAWSLAACSRRS